jgi:hypothetical protein
MWATRMLTTVAGATPAAATCTLVAHAQAWMLQLRNPTSTDDAA